MNITTQTYPWKYFIVDNVLNYEDYISLRKFSEEKNKKYHNIVKKQVLQYEDWDDIHINNIVYNLVKKVKKYCFENKDKFPKLELTDEEYLNVVDLQFSPPAPYSYPIHPESKLKKFSFITYISPNEDNGTHLYVSKYSKKPSVTVPWKLNTAMLFSGINDVTWHSYSTLGDQNRITLNIFFTPKTALDIPNIHEIFLKNGYYEDSNPLKFFKIL